METPRSSHNSSDSDRDGDHGRGGDEGEEDHLLEEMLIAELDFDEEASYELEHGLLTERKPRAELQRILRLD